LTLDFWIHCNPVPRRTRNHPHEAHPKVRPHFGWFGAPVGSGDRVKRCLSEGSAPRTFQFGRRCVETSGDV